MTVRTKKPQSSPAPPAALNQLIVARDQPEELYRALRRRLASCANVSIITDRRQAERRQAAQSVPVDRRRGERRSTLNPRNDLRRRRYIFARPQSRCPHD